MDNNENNTVNTELEQTVDITQPQIQEIPIEDNVETIDQPIVNQEEIQPINEESNLVNNTIINQEEPTPIELPKEEPQTRIEKNEIKENNGKKSNKKIIIPIIVFLVIAILLAILVPPFLKHEKKEEGEVTKSLKESEYRMKGNSLEDFDLFFLKEENKEENIVYSPLSIKYALAMLADASDGDSKEQITSVIGDYKSKKYTNSKNMSLANAFFIKNSFKESVKKEYKDLVSSKYNADVVYDDFSSAKTMNKWISDKTLGLLKDMLSDSDVQDLNFALINALAIDMEWNEIFILHPTAGVTVDYTDYNEEFGWNAAKSVSAIKFSNTKEIAGMEIMASFNNYDIIKELGEDKIRKTVGDAYRKWIKENPTQEKYDEEKQEFVKITLTEDKEIEEEISSYLDKYIKDISKAYGQEDKTTEFKLYTDDDVKVFAKDLKEYDGTTLQYVGIMPINEELSTFVKNTSAKQIQKYIDSLKSLKRENFKDGVVTKIEGYIPKFKYNYDLNLIKDLQSIGIKDVFDAEKANLTGLATSKGQYIGAAKHSANIEFTELGIKASAATFFGGLGAAGGGFYYYYDVPVEIIDMTFDHPYMYIIRDKDTEEVWFTGTVYNPLIWEEEMNKDAIGSLKDSNYIYCQLNDLDYCK